MTKVEIGGRGIEPHLDDERLARRGRSLELQPELGGPNDVGRVTVNYSWQFMTPLVRPFFTNGQVNLRVQSTMKNETLFQ